MKIRSAAPEITKIIRANQRARRNFNFDFFCRYLELFEEKMSSSSNLPLGDHWTVANAWKV